MIGMFANLGQQVLSLCGLLQPDPFKHGIQTFMKRVFPLAAIALLLLTTACNRDTVANSSPATNSAETPKTISSKEQPPVNENYSSNSVPGAIPASFAERPQLNGKATVVMTVKGKPITIEVDGTQAPITAGNFIDLVERGVYTGTNFHRVVRTPEPFVVQGGDPQGVDPNVPINRLGTGNFIDPDTKQDRYIPLEILPAGGQAPVYGKTLKSAGIQQAPALPHRRGALAMARTPLPDSASAQFYFALAELPFLDGDYAVFGYVTNGMDVVDRIQQGDRIESAKVTAGLENFKK
jgi:peptidyl-prolyl cis-trans isomerase B (cyclophilin B)